MAEGTKPSVVLRVEARGEMGAAAGTSFIDDPALLEQLKALGYVR